MEELVKVTERNSKRSRKKVYCVKKLLTKERLYTEDPNKVEELKQTILQYSSGKNRSY